MHPLRVIQKKLKLKEYFLFTFLLLRSEKSRLSPFFKTIFWHKNWMTFKLNTSETGVWIKRRKYFNITILLSLGSNQIISRLFFQFSKMIRKNVFNAFWTEVHFPMSWIWTGLSPAIRVYSRYALIFTLRVFSPRGRIKHWQCMDTRQRVAAIKLSLSFNWSPPSPSGRSLVHEQSCQPLSGSPNCNAASG